jgi:hypothetical protein
MVTGKQNNIFPVKGYRMILPTHLNGTHIDILSHPLVDYLSSAVENLTYENEQLKAEIRLLKGHSSKPSIPPNSKLEGKKSKSEKGVKKNSLH